MTETLFLVLEQSRKRWRGVRIARVSKKRPHLARPSEQALVKIRLTIPDTVLDPKVVDVVINPEHIAAPTITVRSQPAQ